MCHCALDNGQIVGAIFLDISKAFDTVDHALLLSHLVELGLDSDSHQWFNSYVSHRSQCVVTDSNYSTDLVVTSGVPQGSVLGPLLFSVFVNKLRKWLQGVATILFADDTTILLAGHPTADISTALTYALDCAYKWLWNSGLQLNVSKTKSMLIHSKRQKCLPSMNIQLNGTPIERVQSYKFLRVVVNDTLTWDDHIQFVCTKVSKSLNLLRRLAWFLPRKALCCYYSAYVLPCLTYADSVWCTCSLAQSSKLERLQNYMARIILRRRRDSSATEM